MCSKLSDRAHRAPPQLVLALRLPPRIGDAQVGPVLGLVATEGVLVPCFLKYLMDPDAQARDAEREKGILGFF